MIEFSTSNNNLYLTGKGNKFFGLRMQLILKEADISLTNIHDTTKRSLLLLKQPVVILDQTKLTIKNSHPLFNQKKHK